MTVDLDVPHLRQKVWAFVVMRLASYPYSGSMQGNGSREFQIGVA